jgi:hypothetical protein
MVMMFEHVIVSSGLRTMGIWILYLHSQIGPIKVQGIQWKMYVAMYEKRKCKCCTTYTRGVSWSLPFTFKGILRQKKNYENSNTSPFKNITFLKKSSKRKPKYFKILQFYITNLKFQHNPKYHVSKNPHIKINRPIIIYYLGAYENPLSY